MKFTEVKVSELIDFVKSEVFLKLDIKPITELRAFSQFNNPDSKPDDTALIYVEENNHLLAFAGLLPRYINGENIRVFSNSCWWAHPERGKGLAIPVLLKVIEKANSYVYLTETPEHVQPILEKTGLFMSLRKDIGIRGYIRFYFSDIFKKRFATANRLSHFLKPIDFLLNALTSPIRLLYLKKFSSLSYSIENVSKINKELEEFINIHSESDFIKKTPAYFNWVKENPWVNTGKDRAAILYPFTNLVKNYELNYYVFKSDNKIKAFVAISNRDNVSKIPFIYFEKHDIKEVIYTIMKLVLTKKYDSIVIFQTLIVEFINRHKMPFFYRKKEIKYSGTTKKIQSYFNKKPIIQDGEGDAVFT